MSDFWKHFLWPTVFEPILLLLCVAYIVLSAIRVIYGDGRPLTIYEYYHFWRLVFGVFSEVRVG